MQRYKMKTVAEMVAELKASKSSHVLYGDMYEPVDREDVIDELCSLEDEQIGEGSWYECDSVGCSHDANDHRIALTEKDVAEERIREQMKEEMETLAREPEKGEEEMPERNDILMISIRDFITDYKSIKILRDGALAKGFTTAAEYWQGRQKEILTTLGSVLAAAAVNGMVEIKSARYHSDRRGV